MRHVILLLILCLASPAVWSQDSAENDAIFNEEEGAAPCSKLGIHLYHCRPYHCTMSARAQDGFSTEHVIRGYTSDGYRCRHLQSLPDNKLIDCKYSPPMQAVIAKMIVQGQNTLSDQEKALMSETFEKECTIVDISIPN